MKSKVYFYGKFRLRGLIDLLPSVYRCVIVEDDYPHYHVSHFYELSFMGLGLGLEVPIKKKVKQDA